MATWPKISIDPDQEYRHCFGCGPDNPIGLKLSFQWDGKTARAEFTPTEFHQGWSGVVHGGIVICLLDEAMAYAALFQDMHCITAKMQVKLRRQASIGETLVITSSITRQTRKLVEAKAAISLKDGALIAEATATQFIADTNRKSGQEKAESNARQQGRGEAE